MTDAHAAAVEAAALELINQDRARFELPPHSAPSEAFDEGRKAMGIATTAITAFLATMAEAGWVMVRDVGRDNTTETASDYNRGERDGWNACRAIMMAGAAEAGGFDGNLGNFCWRIAAAIRAGATPT